MPLISSNQFLLFILPFVILFICPTTANTGGGSSSFSPSCIFSLLAVYVLAIKLSDKHYYTIVISTHSTCRSFELKKTSPSVVATYYISPCIQISIFQTIFFCMNCDEYLEYMDIAYTTINRFWTIVKYPPPPGFPKKQL